MTKQKIANYREVIFQDIRTGKGFLMRSTVETDQRIQWTDGREYPLVRLDVSSDSHPAYTGEQVERLPNDRVEAFQRKYRRASN